MDYYELLGVQRNATVAEISAAYRRLALSYHPDRISDPTLVEKFSKKFKEVTDAFQTLIDPSKRAIYNGKFPVKRKVTKPVKNMTDDERWAYIMANDPNFTNRPSSIVQPPKYDIWGKKLTEEERQQWLADNTDTLFSKGWGIPPKKVKRPPPPPKDGFVDVFAKYYEKDNPPTLNR